MDKSFKEQLFDTKYYATPYDSNQDCLLSVLVCCRMTRGIGGPTDILKLISSIFQYWSPLSQSKTEILIKFDLDDELAIHEVLEKNMLEKIVTDFGSPSPPKLRYFIYGRWEGKKTFNYHYQYLFSQRNPKSKFITFATDDSFYQKDLLHVLNIPISKYGVDKPKIFIRSCMITQILNSITDYRNPEELRKWASGELTDPFPIVSSNIIEWCGNMGWGQNIDNWLSLLGVVVYKKYGINLLEDLPISIERKTDERPGLEARNYSQFNKEMFVDDTTFPQNQYYFDLVEQQAKNLYLNIKNI